MINRLEATRYVVAQVTDEPIVASLGNAKFDLFMAKDRPQNFYMWNSMGMASSMGLGLAMARPQQKVIILDGDGALLMNLNSLTTAASRAPSNLIHVVWDNSQFELTGGQPTPYSLSRRPRYDRPGLRLYTSDIRGNSGCVRRGLFTCHESARPVDFNRPYRCAALPWAPAQKCDLY